jgi:hypothetical protein
MDFFEPQSTEELTIAPRLDEGRKIGLEKYSPC